MTFYRNIDYIVPNGRKSVTSKIRAMTKNQSKHLLDETVASHNLTSVSRLWAKFRKKKCQD
jgi:hypothetical protein